MVSYVVILLPLNISVKFIRSSFFNECLFQMDSLSLSVLPVVGVTVYKWMHVWRKWPSGGCAGLTPFFSVPFEFAM